MEVWQYDVVVGNFYDPSGHLVGRGYSGRATGRNNVLYEHCRGYGPIPRGLWFMGRGIDHPRLGPQAIPLLPRGHTAFGRSEFFIHGDKIGGNASRGCIILDRHLRDTLARSDNRMLKVFSGDYIFDPPVEISGSVA